MNTAPLDLYQYSIHFLPHRLIECIFPLYSFYSCQTNSTLLILLKSFNSQVLARSAIFMHGLRHVNMWKADNATQHLFRPPPTQRVHFSTACPNRKTTANKTWKAFRQLNQYTHTDGRYILIERIWYVATRSRISARLDSTEEKHTGKAHRHNQQ